MNITIIFKDGTTREFKHEGRPGGSYTKNLKLEAGFAVVEDEWGHTTAFPESSIKEIKTSPTCW